MTVRVLLVDDDDLVRVGLKVILDSDADLEVVGEASSGAQAIELLVRRGQCCESVLHEHSVRS